MAKRILDARVRQKKDTLANWNANPLILEDGEQAFVVSEDGSGLNFKIGDGTKRFSDLSWFTIVVNGESLVVVDTIEDMRNLPSEIIEQLETGLLKGVQVNGYYSKGDTPASIIYYLSDTTADDDGGSVIDVSGVKLEHIFQDFVAVTYFGIKEGEDSSIRIQEILNKGFKLDGLSKTLTLDSPISVNKLNLRNCTISSKSSEEWSTQNYIITCENLNETSSISNIVFDGSDKSGGIQILNSNNFTISDCKFINNGYIGLYLEYCNEVNVVNSYSENNGWNYISSGNSGIRFEYCNYCKLDNYTAKNEYGKVATFSNSTYCSLNKFTCTESDTEQPIIYLSRGNNNTCFDLTIRGSKHPLKLSRQESNSLVSNFFFDSSDFSMTGYSSILIQGGINNVINNGKLVNGTTDASV